MRKPEEYNPLTIGLMGYNTQQTYYGMQLFENNNREQIKSHGSNGLDIILNDETRIIPISPSLNFNLYLRGRRLDQLILFDDERWNIEIKHSDLIKKILHQYILSYTCVPDDYIIMRYLNE